MLRPYSKALTRQDLRLNSATEGFPLRLHIAYKHLTTQSITCQEQVQPEDTCVLLLISLGEMAACKEAIK